MHDKLTHKLTLVAMLTALVCAATLISFPSPGGYSNLGDGILLLSTFLIGPVWGPVTAAVGSAMADLILGCGYYIPGTLVVKGLSALIAGLIFLIGRKADRKYTPLRLFCAAVPAELWMVLGYWIYKSFLLGNPAGAMVSLPRNLLQGAIGAAAAILLYSILIQKPSIRQGSYYEK